MLLHVHRDEGSGERRVALVPRETKSLVAAGHEVVVAAGAGERAGFPDDAYRIAGGAIGTMPRGAIAVAVEPETVALEGAHSVIGFLDPLGSPDGMRRLASMGLTAFALELVPRTTKAQSMDALSSQATVAGYEAVVMAAAELPRFFPMMMTAAGTIRPASVLILGAGVAGLQAIATARRLGAVVSAYDIRPAAAEQVESLGARFVGGPVASESQMEDGYAVEVDEATRQAQQDALAEAVSRADVIVATAQVPGRAAPLLVSPEMVETMKPGSLIVDVAAPTGGNCALTRPGEVVVHGGTTIHGPLHLPSRGAGHASEMLSRNVASLFEHLVAVEAFDGATDDDIAAATLVTAGGEVVHERVLQILESA